MGIVEVKAHLAKFQKETQIVEHTVSTATVQQAADALQVAPEQIAKTLSFKVNDEAILIVMAGDAKVDNAKYKAFFGAKAKMLTPEEVTLFTGHTIGGVCPFGLAQPLRVYLDASLKRFETIYPACGTPNSSIELKLDELTTIVDGTWIEVSKGWQTVEI